MKWGILDRSICIASSTSTAQGARRAPDSPSQSLSVAVHTAILHSVLVSLSAMAFARGMHHMSQQSRHLPGSVGRLQMAGYTHPTILHRQGNLAQQKRWISHWTCHISCREQKGLLLSIRGWHSLAERLALSLLSVVQSPKSACVDFRKTLSALSSLKLKFMSLMLTHSDFCTFCGIRD